MKRTTTPDKYSELAKEAYEQLRDGRTTPRLFSIIIRAIWYARHNETQHGA